MSRHIPLRGAAIAVLALIALTLPSMAQQSLPTIDVGARVKHNTTQVTRAASNRDATVTARTEAAPARVPLTRANDPKTYSPSDATTALKISTPIMETPASIQVVSKQVIRDEQVTTLSRAVENVSGVFAYDEKQGNNTQLFSIRGFDTPVYYRDGVRTDTQASVTGAANFANVERVEVLKGPASILYGRADPGGIVNIVTKKPQATPFSSVTQQLGSFGFYRTSIDSAGPITKDDTLLYRLNLSYEDSHGFQQNTPYRDLFVAPVFRWNIDPSTYVDAYLDYSINRSPPAIFLPAFTRNDPLSAVFGARPLALPRERNFQDPMAYTYSNNIRFGSVITHKFNEDWRLTHRFQGEISRVNYYQQFYFLDPANWTELQGFNAISPAVHTHSYYTNVDLSGKFDLLGTEHKFLLGGDFQHLDHDESDFSGIPALVTKNLFFPIESPVRPLIDPASRFDFAYRTNWYGFYLQDQAKLPFNIHLLAGVRYDRAVTYDVVARETFDNSQKVTPRFGLLWRPIPQFSVYGSYLSNFGGPNAGGRRPLPPETAQQWEVGVKTELLDDRFTATLAWYNLVKQNIAGPDPNALLASQGFLTAVGEVRAKGLELDVAGEILPGWRIIGAYSYINSLIVKDRGLDFINPDADGNPTLTAGNTGHQWYNVPRHSGSLWTTYEFQDGDWKGLKFGGGAVARSIRQGDLENDFQLPGYATIGLMSGYDTLIEGKKVKLQINVDNLLSTRYYTASSSSLVQIGAPRIIRGSIGVEF